MAKKTMSKQRAFWYRLLLIPYAVLFYWLMGLFDLHNLDFLKRFMDFWGRNAYTLNFVCAFSWVAGLGKSYIATSKKFPGTIQFIRKTRNSICHTQWRR